MRPIKFRAWDKKEKKWLLGYEYPNLGGFSMFGETMMMGEYAGLLSSYFPDRIEDIVLMQFTGLHDKNGKPVYEGDIVKGTFANGIGSFQEMIGDIFYNQQRAEFAVQAASHPDNQWSIPQNCEIIGNVYENPELL